MDILSLELRKLGLKEKEVLLYLAGLELGATSVQNLAKKAGVTRPTAYEIIKRLMERGLFAETKKDKRSVFFAQAPEKILSILRLQKRELEEKEREFIRIIAALESRAGKAGGLQLFRGKEGLAVLEEQIAFTPSGDIEVFTSETNAAEKKRRKGWYEAIRRRLGPVSFKEHSVPRLKGTLILADKVIFLSRKQQEGYLIDNPLVLDSLKSLF